MRLAQGKVFSGMNKEVTRSVKTAAALIILALSTGCAHINMNQLAYEVLSQEDCRINQLDDFCTRNFAKEYHEYERLRRDFMRSQEQPSWRTSPDMASVNTEFLNK